jgi:pyruvate formate lyase activating enzyme
MISGRVESIESFSSVDGPGIRVMVFLGGCKLRCRYCHNPEMQVAGKPNMTTEELLQKIRRFKPYFRYNSGGVTFSGGEPLLHSDFLKELLPKLKRENIHVALDTAGVGTGNVADYEEILQNTDLVILDIKHTLAAGFQHLTGGDQAEAEKFMDVVIKLKKPLWIRQVVVPGLTDFPDYLSSLAKYLRRFQTIERIDFLPYHKLGSEKYQKLNRPYIYQNKPAMDIGLCHQLEQKFIQDHPELLIK